MKSVAKNKFAARTAAVLMAALMLFPGLGVLPVAAQSGSVPAGAVRTDSEPLYLYPGGMPFGVRFFTDGVLVIGFADTDAGRAANPAAKAGVRIGDVITAVGNVPVEGADHLASLIEASGGKEVTLTLQREGKKVTLKLTPVNADGKYRTGVWVRDSGAGIGTVTFITKNGTTFAGLGHGICDTDTGKLIPMRRGTVTGVTVSQIVRGQPGAPGEIKGYFSAEKTGALLGNTECGVFGMLTEKPAAVPEDAMEAARPEQLHDGDAYIWCTLDSGAPHKYSVKLSNIDCSEKGNKCFTVTVTDPALLEISGGIVQGMSGSPIVQDGRLVGAVTHVLINDPTTGYGIFITNMLEQMPDILKNAA